MRKVQGVQGVRGRRSGEVGGEHEVSRRGQDGEGPADTVHDGNEVRNAEVAMAGVSTVL